MCEFAEAGSAHYISDGGRVRIGRTESRNVEVHVVQQIEELGAELKLHPLIDMELFESCHINIEEAWIRQHITRRVAECAGGIGGEKRGVEVLIHHLSVRSVPENCLADVAADKIGAIESHTGARILCAAVDRKTETVLPGVDAGDLPSVGEV